jgi:hypothetical protein
MLRLIETLNTILEAKDELKRVLGLRQGYNPAGTHTHRGREGPAMSCTDRTNWQWPVLPHSKYLYLRFTTWYKHKCVLHSMFACRESETMRILKA